jgi:O-acetyl-ADP-ribose deacetylase (regulator of RNase III)
VIRVEVGDIASYAVDAIVRPASASLASLPGDDQETATAYHVRQPLDVGAAVVTDAAHGAAEFVIHAVLASPEKPIFAGGVRLALESAMHQVRAWRFGSVAMPLLGSGPDGLPTPDAASLLAEVVCAETRTATDPPDVCIVVGSDEDRSLVEAHLRRWLAHES